MTQQPATTKTILTPDHPLVTHIDIVRSHEPLERRPKLDYDYLSGSQLGTLRRCGMQYYLKYGEKLTEQPNSKMEFGTAFHIGCHTYLEQKRAALAHGEYANFDQIGALADAKAASLTYLSNLARRTPDLEMKPRWQKGPLETFESLRTSVTEALDLALLELFESITPIALEQGYVIHWRDRSILPLLGFSDAIVQLPDGTHAPYDFKTSGKQKSNDTLALDDTMSGYALAHELATGIPTRTVQYGIIVRNKVPKTQHFSGTRIYRDFLILRALCKIATVAIGSGVFMPDRTDDKCPSCGFYDRCTTLLSQEPAA